MSKVVGAGGKGYSAEIRITGLEETIAALRSLAPDVLKRLNREMRGIGRLIASDAARSAPPGHTLIYRVRMRQRGKKAGMSVMAVDRDTAIFEFAGTKMRNRAGNGPPTPQGLAMINWLNGFGSPGRFLWDSWDRNKDRIEASIRESMAGAERELQERLNAAGEVF